MEVFKWNDRYNVGVEVIDAQHRSLMELLNECNAQVARTKSAGVDKELVERLKNYAAFHFRFEEDLMQSVGVADIARHRVQHDYFESRVADLESQGDAGQIASLLSFLRDWFIHHVLGEDRLYVPMVQAKQR